MTVTAWVLLVVYGLIVTFWKVFHLLLFFYKPKRWFLDRRSPRLAGDNGPFVSILLAAKDEEANVGTCVRSVLESEYPHYELIVIDDRSKDRTGAAVLRAAAGDPRVRLVRVDELPAGWTGKMNAIRQGMERARGDVLLIMDADTRHTPGLLAAALYRMKQKDAAVVSLLPRIEHRSFFSKMVQPLIGVLLLLWKPLPWINSRKRKGTSLAWGGFLMIRRDALKAVGGLEAVKDRFAADIGLASRCKKAGYRIRLLHAPELLSTYMYAGLRDLLNGWARILRITADDRPEILLLTALALVPLCLSAYPMMAVGLAALVQGTGDRLPLILGWMGLMHLLFQVWLFGRFYRISGSNPQFAWLHLPAVLVTGWVTVLAWVRSHSTQMTWRGTAYQLRANGRACPGR